MMYRVMSRVGVCIIGLLLFLPLSVAAETAGSKKTVEESVRSFFATTPVMIEIAGCESKFRQFNTDGSVLKGGWGGKMVGVFQFYESVHKSAATALGFDLATLEGNLSYAKHVYAQQGTIPWNSSKSCWGTAVSVATPAKVSDADKAKLLARIEVLKKQLAQLQRLLEQKKAVSQR